MGPLLWNHSYMCIIILLVQTHQASTKRDKNGQCICDCEYYRKNTPGSPCYKESRIRPCPYGWTELSNPRSCIRVFHDYLHFLDAQAQCRQFGGDLALPHSLDNLRKIGESLRTGSFPYVWLGLNDRGKEGTWTWSDNEHDTGNFTNWDAKHGRTPKKHCAKIDTITHLWSDEYCERKLYVVCNFDRRYGGIKTCPLGWTLILTNPLECIKILFELRTFEEAKEICYAYFHSELLHIRNKKKLDLMRVWFIEAFQAWIAAQYSNGRWSFMHGPTVYDQWIAHQDYLTGNESCLAVGYWNGESKLYKTDCGRKIRLVCVKESSIGPRDFDMREYYHGEEGLFYLDQPILLTCSMFGSEGGNMTWMIFDEENKNHSKLATTYTRSLLVKHERKCRNKSTIFYKTTADISLSGKWISCFHGDELALDTRCYDDSHRLPFCHSTRQIFIVDGPKGRPKLTVKYSSYPKPARDGELISVTCTVQHGRYGELIWVERPDGSKPRVIDLDGEKFNINFTKYVDENTTVATEVSVLEFRMSVEFHGMYVACFSHDATIHDKALYCPMRTEFPTFCRRTQTFELKYPPLIGPFNFWWLLMFLLVFVFFPPLHYLNCRRKTSAGGKSEEKDRQKAAVDVSVSTRKRSSADSGKTGITSRGSKPSSYSSQDSSRHD